MVAKALLESYSIADLNSKNLEEQLEERQFFYNWHRPHGALQGKAPINNTWDFHEKTPLGGEGYKLYDASKETIRVNHTSSGRSDHY